MILVVMLAVMLVVGLDNFPTKWHAWRKQERSVSGARERYDMNDSFSYF